MYVYVCIYLLHICFKFIYKYVYKAIELIGMHIALLLSI